MLTLSKMHRGNSWSLRWYENANEKKFQKGSYSMLTKVASKLPDRPSINIAKCEHMSLHSNKGQT